MDSTAQSSFESEDKNMYSGDETDECNNKENEVKAHLQEATDAPESTEVTEPKTEQELLYCKFCDVQATDLQTFVFHVMKPSHIKKAADGYNIRLLRDAAPQIYNCQECLISCNGETAWNQHLLGQRHRKILEKKSAKVAEQRQQLMQPPVRNSGGGPVKQKFNQAGNTFNKKPYQRPMNSSYSSTQADFANYEEPLIGLEHVTEIQVAGQNPRYHCTLCDSKFDHNLKFPHLVGAKHRMNVLKIKRPDVLKDARLTTQKRSELTAMLLKEARKLEEEEGRQQVKTKFEKSPFIAREALQADTYTGRGGASQRSRGGRGGYMTDRAFRGLSHRGKRGASRGGGWQSTTQEHSYGSQQYGNQQYPSSSPYNSSYDQWSMPYNAGYDNYKQTADYRTSFDRPLAQAPLDYTSDNNYSETSRGHPSQDRGGYSNFASNSTSKPEKEESQKPPVPTSLAAALGDLTKLVQNEDDASVALHVSNALTQALLQYRIHQDEDKGE